MCYIILVGKKMFVKKLIELPAHRRQEHIK